MMIITWTVPVYEKKKKFENILLMQIGDKNDIDDDLC